MKSPWCLRLREGEISGRIDTGDFTTSSCFLARLEKVWCPLSEKQGIVLSDFVGLAIFRGIIKSILTIFPAI